MLAASGPLLTALSARLVRRSCSTLIIVAGRRKRLASASFSISFLDGGHAWCIAKSYAEQTTDAITMGLQPEYRAARRHRARAKHRPATGTRDNGQRLAAIDVYNLHISFLSNQQSQLDLQHTRCARKHIVDFSVSGAAEADFLRAC